MLIFALVARGPVVLAEHCQVEVDVSLLVARLLRVSPVHNTRQSYTNADLHFHMLVSNGITFLCMCHAEDGYRFPYAFLGDVAERWAGSMGDRGLLAGPYDMNDSFGRVLQERMEYFERNPEADKFRKARHQMQSAKETLVQDLEKLLERGSEMELLLANTEDLESHSFTFHKRTKKLHSKEWRRTGGLWLILCLIISCVLLAVIYGILALVCNGFSLPRCRATISSS